MLQVGEKVGMPAAGMHDFAVEVVEQVGGRDRVVVGIEMFEHQARAHPFHTAVERPSPGDRAARFVDQKVSGGFPNVVCDDVEARDQRSPLCVKMVPQAVDRKRFISAGFGSGCQGEWQLDGLASEELV